MAPPGGHPLDSLAVASQDHPSTVLAQYEKRIMPKNPLSERSPELREATPQAKTLKERLGNPVSAPAGAAHVGDGQQGSDDAGHPVVFVCEMVKKVELKAALKPSRDKVGFPLPEIGIQLDPHLLPYQGMQPARQVYVDELHVWKRLVLERRLNSLAVLGGGENPQPMHAAQALDHVPGQKIPPTWRARRRVDNARVSANQYAMTHPFIPLWVFLTGASSLGSRLLRIFFHVYFSSEPPGCFCNVRSTRLRPPGPFPRGEVKDILSTCGIASSYGRIPARVRSRSFRRIT